MPRVKVPLSEKGMRAAQACEHCKIKKLKCDGSQPCNSCERRRVHCRFTAKGDRKSRQQQGLPANVPVGEVQDGGLMPSSVHGNPVSTPLASYIPGIARMPCSFDSIRSTFKTPQLNMQSFWDIPLPGLNEACPQDPSPLGVKDEEEICTDTSSLLEDGRGNTTYFGESCALSYMYTVSKLTNRDTATEAILTPQETSSDAKSLNFDWKKTRTSPLPCREATTLLIHAFFMQTQGIVVLYDRDRFLKQADETFRYPLSAKPTWLCVLNIVLAIGLQSYTLNSDVSIEKLKSLGLEKPEQAESFFATAKQYRDPLSLVEVDRGDCNLVQILILFTIYFVVIGKRNTGYIHHGIAVQVAYTLGLHQTHQKRLNPKDAENSSRISLWRNLYIMDRLISAFSGRPPSINDFHCSDPLVSGTMFGDQRRTRDSIQGMEISDHLSIMVSCAKILGIILERVYQRRDLSTQSAISISLDLQAWVKSLPPSYHVWCTDICSQEPLPTKAHLTVWLLYFYSVTLLTRPFLIIYIRNITNRTEAALKSYDENLEIKRLSETCVRSAIRTIKTIQTMRERGFGSECDPFISAWLFMAALVAITNTSFKIVDDREAADVAAKAILLQKASAMSNNHGKMYLALLLAFREKIILVRKLDNALEATSSVIENLVDNPQRRESSFTFGLPADLSGECSVDVPFNLGDDLSSLAVDLEQGQSADWFIGADGLDLMWSND